MLYTFNGFIDIFFSEELPKIFESVFDTLSILVRAPHAASILEALGHWLIFSWVYFWQLIIILHLRMVVVWDLSRYTEHVFFELFTAIICVDTAEVPGSLPRCWPLGSKLLRWGVVLLPVFVHDRIKLKSWLFGLIFWLKDRFKLVDWVDRLPIMLWICLSMDISGLCSIVKGVVKLFNITLVCGSVPTK